MAQTLNPLAFTTLVEKSGLNSTKADATNFKGQHGVRASFVVRKQLAGASVPATAMLVPPLPDGVRVVTAAEYKQAAACLAEAFAEDEVARYFIDVPDRSHWTAEEKWNLHVEILEYVTYAHILKGLVTVAGDFEAVALWCVSHFSAYPLLPSLKTRANADK